MSELYKINEHVKKYPIHYMPDTWIKVLKDMLSNIKLARNKLHDKIKFY